ncbi:endoribonuclease GhoS [Candidatus Pantoea deserta]|uniref:Endoribonuclease GhoS n=1 Tax=Candidatus Pantoea deserta TaxID=1869313 RepID=A0A3N4P029_9GAMM|nr:type V toxin-antitoxin system endoribonuclease antitoxin GhoS [Pantoea deserta]RPD98396.1 endoribonuclease GhoS [Pantoea deserta]
MSDDLKRYIVTFRYQESGLSDIQRLNSAMVAAGFTTTLSDDEGKAHDLGTNSFGLISALSQEELQQQAIAAGESVLHQKPEVSVTTLEAFLRDASQ